MPTRRLVVVRHGAADALGELTTLGRRQSELLGRRLTPLPIKTIWHAAAPRALHTARIVSAFVPAAVVERSAELNEHVPYVPEVIPREWRTFFAAHDDTETGSRQAESLLARFARPAAEEIHELVVTHAPQVAWLVRDALGLPPERWLSLPCGNTAVNVIGYTENGPPDLLLRDDRDHLPPGLR